MAVSWGEIFQHLMGAGLIVSRGTKEKLEQHEDPIGLIASLRSKGIKGKLTPDMVTKKYREENAGNPMFGHCYHSSQALYYLMDTDRLEQMSAIDYHDCSHWWLRDKITNEIFDITAEQYYSVNQEPPYPGKKKNWYGWKQRPHQRTLDLMVKVLGDRLIEDTVTTPELVGPLDTFL